jgi:ribonucleotide reductase alpha subunit
MIDAPQEQLQMQGIDPLQGQRFLVRKRDGRIEEFNDARILLAIESAFKAHHGLGPNASLPPPFQVAVKQCAEKVAERVLSRAVRGEELEVERIQDTVEEQLMLAGHVEVARRYILYREQRRLARAEREGRPKPSAGPPAGASVPASPELRSIYAQVLPKQREGENFEAVYRRHFDGCLNEGDYWRLLTPELLEFDSDALARALRLERDQQLTGAGLEALRETGLLRENGRCLETPQYFWMRVAMGLALNEEGRPEGRALEFYEALSTFRFIPSDLILRHAGTRQPDLRSRDPSDLTPAFSPVEPWRRDILEALDLYKRLWIPDLFMKRVSQQASWTLLDPAETGDLHDCHGSAFERRYLHYEKKADEGKMRFAKRLNAGDLWHEMVALLARMDKPRLGFKDAILLRAQQADDQVAASPLGAINLAAHISESGRELDVPLLRATVASAVRMLDNALDLSFYPADSERAASLEHRAIGLGIAGLSDALARLHLKRPSAAAADFADWSMELVSFCAIQASAGLARQRGPYPRYADSNWSRGILPIDTFWQLAQERGLRVDVPATMFQDWTAAREMVRRHGMRHAALNALASFDAPARIAGLSPEACGAEAGAEWWIDCAARRQKWIDGGQTLLLPAPERDAGKIAALYMQAWEKGLKLAPQFCAAQWTGPVEEPAAKPPVEAGVIA